MAKPHIPPARRAAMAVVQAVVHDRQELQAALHTQMTAYRLDGPSRRLCNTLCYGFFRYRLRLLWFIDRFLKNPHKLPPQFRDILALASYELFFLRSIPDYASVNWAVTAVTALFNRRMGAVSNGVLRNVVRNRSLFFDPSFYKKHLGESADFFAVFYSCPPWITDLLLQQYPEDEAVLYFKSFLQEPPLGIRFNPLHTETLDCRSELASSATVIDAEASGMAIREHMSQDIADYEKRGILSRQSFASYQALCSLNPSSFIQPVADICAGRGGKTCAMLEAGIQNIYASDRSWPRLRQLPEEIHRLGLPHIPVYVSDNADNPALSSSPGTILADLPCSGIGVLSRRPDGKLRTSDISGLLEIQRKLLASAMEMLQPKGTLAIITCTLNEAENEAHLDFLRESYECGVKHVWKTPATSQLHEFFWTALIEKRSL